MITRTEAFRVCTDTGDAYSRNNYTSPGWFRIGENLAKRGFSSAQIEVILRSKWMRWTVDGSDKPWGCVTSADFERSFGAATKSPLIFLDKASADMIDHIKIIEGDTQ
jgi:hypothetical protein